MRALDGEDLTVADFRLHAPTLDDVFLAKTGRSRAARRLPSRRPCRHDGQVLELARRSLLQTLRQPALVVPSIVFRSCSSRSHGGLDAASGLPGFPSASYFDFIIAVPFIQGSLFA